MTKILFVCHGNICRSPMAEFIMKDIVSKANLSKKYEIASAATSTEEIGECGVSGSAKEVSGQRYIVPREDGAPDDEIRLQLLRLYRRDGR